MFITDFTHAGGRDVNRTTEIIKEVAGGLMTSDGTVRVGLVSNPCPDVSNVDMDASSTAEEFASFVTTGKQKHQLSGILHTAREKLTYVAEGARKGVKRLAVVFVHGPISDLKESAKQVMRAKFARNDPGVQFVFVGMGGRAQERQLLQLASERNPNDVRMLLEEEGRDQITWQDVLASVCEG
nr:hypothetical protein BaRGS_005635 [Batillaria attramentaria]